ncbi:hypothetical protein BDZ85DRAFT_262863 [Elsinoe ampelina]|uniref:Uncharacterized protein n=1 Tax=Elsinoe ampelina TaxID=302913 RepID=A0A6A6GBJ2_9PEZI|nr:hypothetical protein BDZ85DRAFT_262863 [Elsinoe ampelina]
MHHPQSRPPPDSKTPPTHSPAPTHESSPLSRRLPHAPPGRRTVKGYILLPRRRASHLRPVTPVKPPSRTRPACISLG